MRANWLVLVAALLPLGGCHDDDPVAVVDVIPPAAPRGVYSVTGDHEVFVHWLANTESDVAGYRVYQGPCASGPSCPYTLVGSTAGTTLRVPGLPNGLTSYFAVAAFDHSGNESDLSYEDVFDTPRPEGFGLALNNYLEASAGSGYDFSAYLTCRWDDPETDIFFGYDGVVYQVFVPDFSTDIQDAGFASTLDAVDYAPDGGWSPTGTAELIPGHCYVVWTRDNHFAKFRVTQIRPGGATSPAQVVLDWAYQVDPGNPELKARPARPGGEGETAARPIYWAR